MKNRLLIYIYHNHKGWCGYTETPDGVLKAEGFDDIDPAGYYFIGKVSARCRKVWDMAGFEFVFEEPKPNSLFTVPDIVPRKPSAVIVSRTKGAKRQSPTVVPLSSQVSTLPYTEEIKGTITHNKAEEVEGQYLYKREGDTLTIYKKVLVEKYKLA